MKHKFIHTTNTRVFLSKIDEVERRGAQEKCFMVVDGEPGRGKTTTTEWYAVSNNLPFLRAKREWTSQWFLRELLDRLAIVPEHGFEKMYRQTVRGLGDRAAAARHNGETFAIIIDEADHIVRSERIMETIRDLTDPIETPIILVGMGKINSALTRFPQIASRVSAHAKFEALTLEDTRALISGRAEVEVAPDLTSYLHAMSKGFAREVLEGIGAIERTGRRLGRPVELKDMEGQTLLNDRGAGKPIIVRAA
jgi:DNA transposition AAA+ family ATPase